MTIGTTSQCVGLDSFARLKQINQQLMIGGTMQSRQLMMDPQCHQIRAKSIAVVDSLLKSVAQDLSESARFPALPVPFPHDRP